VNGPIREEEEDPVGEWERESDGMDGLDGRELDVNDVQIEGKCGLVVDVNLGNVSWL